MDSESQDEKWGGVRFRLFFSCLLGEYACDDVDGELAALDEKDEADDRQVGEKGTSDGH